MEPLQKQVITLSHKVDALYQIIDELNGKVATALSECRLAPVPENGASEVDLGGHYLEQTYRNMRSAMEHKDIIADAKALDSNHQNSDRELTPEIQIQRLTAQLTAAYNRIAALEEQLLAQRIH